MGLPAAHPWLCLLTLSPQLDSSQALGCWSLSTWQRWCTARETNLTAPGASSCAMALAPGLHRAAPLPCPADAGVELLGDAEPWGGDRIKNKEQENVKLYLNLANLACAFQKWWSTTPWPTGEEHRLPNLLPAGHDGDQPGLLPIMGLCPLATLKSLNGSSSLEADNHKFYFI